MHIVPTSNLELENVYSTVRSSASKMVRTTLPNALKKFKNKKIVGIVPDNLFAN